MVCTWAFLSSAVSPGKKEEDRRATRVNEETRFVNQVKENQSHRKNQNRNVKKEPHFDFSVGLTSSKGLTSLRTKVIAALQEANLTLAGLAHHRLTVLDNVELVARLTLADHGLFSWVYMRMRQI